MTDIGNFSVERSEVAACDEGSWMIDSGCGALRMPGVSKAISLDPTCNADGHATMLDDQGGRRLVSCNRHMQTEPSSCHVSANSRTLIDGTETQRKGFSSLNTCVTDGGC